MAMVNEASEPAAAMSRVHEAVAEGAHIIEVAVGPDAESERAVRFIAAVREAYPELIVGVSTGRHEVALQACTAGADLLQLYTGLIYRGPALLSELLEMLEPKASP